MIEFDLEKMEADARQLEKDYVSKTGRQLFPWKRFKDDKLFQKYWFGCPVFREVRFSENLNNKRVWNDIVLGVKPLNYKTFCGLDTFANCSVCINNAKELLPCNKNIYVVCPHLIKIHANWIKERLKELKKNGKIYNK